MYWHGIWNNPPGLPTGQYCDIFLEDVRYNSGTGVLDNQSIIKYNWDTFSFYYPDPQELTGSDGTQLRAGQTVARDCKVIPTRNLTTAKKRSCQYTSTVTYVDLDQVGTELEANDVGALNDIAGYRIDLYNGVGKSSCNDFNNTLSVGACDPGTAACPASDIQ